MARQPAASAPGRGGGAGRGWARLRGARLLVALVLALAVMAGGAPPAVAAANSSFTVGSPRCLLAGKPALLEQAPVVRQGAVYLALRDAAAALGVTPGELAWDGLRRTVTVRHGAGVMVLAVGSRAVLLNGHPWPLVAPVQLVAGRVQVPLAGVARALGMDVSWDAGVRTVSLSAPDSAQWDRSGSSSRASGVERESRPREFAWTTGGQPCRVTVAFSTLDYQRLGQLPRPLDYRAYLEEDLGAATVAELAWSIRGAAAGAGVDERQAVLAFVQGAIPYVLEAGGEYPQYPLQTVVDGGDCEDKVLLAASLMKALGERPALLVFPGHMALGLAGDDLEGTSFRSGGTAYYCAETTAPGWSIGQLPARMAGRTPSVIPVDGP
ncbi:MAG: copper amine oxidase N-terminal domain-containing protein [Syntrophomonadaceae bacterium]|nr:copper amine oxidase N-terminal domain-containing protein [Syntrophomonadaceae bacterium]